MRAALLLPLAAAAAVAQAQQLEARFLTEFRRVGPGGAIIAADSAGSPREIISPALVRNGFTSFHLTVKGPVHAKFMLHLASNPDGLLRPALYRVQGDALDPVQGLSVPGVFNDHGVGLFWLDVWTPASTPVRRIRLEAQLNFEKDWVITPLEIRVVTATVPENAPPWTNAITTGHAGAAPFALLAQHLCATPAPAKPPLQKAGVLAKIRRNAGQDILIARKLPGIEALLLKPLGAATAAEWCGGPRDHPDPETYLRVRDAIWRAAQ